MLLPLSILHQYINFIMFPLSCFVLRFLLKKYSSVFQNQINIWWEPRPRQRPYQNIKKLFSRNSLFLYFFVLLILLHIFSEKSNKFPCSGLLGLLLWPLCIPPPSRCVLIGQNKRTHPLLIYSNSKRKRGLLPLLLAEILYTIRFFLHHQPAGFAVFAGCRHHLHNS